MNKLLCITPLFPSKEKPFYCIYLYQQLCALQDIGWDVTVLIPEKGNCEQVEDGKYLDIKIKKITYTSKSFLKFFEIYSYNAKKLFKQVFESGNYDVIALNLCSLDFEKNIIDLVPETSKKVIHFHGLNVWKDYYIAHPLLEKILFFRKKYVHKKADGIIGVSNKVCAVAAEHIKKEKIFTVYNGVDPNLFYPVKREGKNEFTIVCVANLIKIKGHEYLLKALEKVKENRKENDIPIKLKIVGDGPLRDDLTKTVEEMGLVDMVTFTGNVDYLKVAEMMRKECDLFIMPSYFESLGCVYLEAMASGVPVVGVRGCGIDEIIEDRKNGFLVDPKNSDEIAEIIEFAIDKPDELAKIATRGYETVTSGYTWKRSAEELDKAYKKIINDGRG